MIRYVCFPTETMGIYTNVQSRGDNVTSTRVSPFNFHAMISGAASVTQAKTMASKWLLQDEGFCLTENDSSTDTADSRDTSWFYENETTPTRMTCTECSYVSGIDAHQPAKQVGPSTGPASIVTCCAACKANPLCENFVSETRRCSLI